MPVVTAPPEKSIDKEDKSRTQESLKDKIIKYFSKLNTHCREIEEAKAICDRENTAKHGKDWVNRCCG